MALTKITVTGNFPAPAAGKVTFALTKPLIDTVDAEVVSNGPVVGVIDASGVLVDEDGNAGVSLVANDAANVSPVGTRYFVTVSIVGAAERSAYVIVPAGATGGTIDLSALLAAA